MAYRSSSTVNGTGSLSVAVPAGVAIDDIVFLYASRDTGTFTAITWPTGFTQLQDVGIGTPDGQQAFLAWKRLTAVDSGSYTITQSLNILSAIAFSGRDTANPPVSSSNTSTVSNASPVTVSASTLTALAGDDLLWISAPDTTGPTPTGAAHTAPTGYTLQRDDKRDANITYLAAATLANASAGATGTVSGTFTFGAATGAGWMAFLVRIPAAAAAASIPRSTIITQAVKRASYW